MNNQSINNDIKTHILIGDDIEVNIKILTRILQTNKYDVSIAMDGPQAIEKARSIHPDLILLDVLMPDVSGFDVCKQLKENYETQEIPIIFLTAQAEINSMVKGFNLGAVDYITKPFDPTELLARVNTHIELKRSREQLKKSYMDLQESQEKRESRL